MEAIRSVGEVLEDKDLEDLEAGIVAGALDGDIRYDHVSSVPRK